MAKQQKKKPVSKAKPAKNKTAPAKAAKSAKPVAKAKAKPAAKVVAKARPAPKGKAVAAKPAPAKAVGKKEVALPKVAAKTKNPVPADAKKTGKVTGKAKKDEKPKKTGKGKEEVEFEEPDDLFDDGEFAGSEDIPEFEEESDEDVEIDIEEVAIVAPSDSDEIILTDAEGRRFCRVRDCDQLSIVEGYCRFHYLLLWKKIQVRKKILDDGKLARYVEELTSRYPDKFLEMIRKDLRTEKEFLAAIQELEIDESNVDNEFEDETQSYIDEVRGLTTESGTTTDEEEF